MTNGTLEEFGNPNLSSKHKYKIDSSMDDNKKHVTIYSSNGYTYNFTLNLQLDKGDTGESIYISYFDEFDTLIGNSTTKEGSAADIIGQIITCIDISEKNAIKEISDFLETEPKHVGINTQKAWIEAMGRMKILSERGENIAGVLKILGTGMEITELEGKTSIVGELINKLNSIENPDIMCIFKESENLVEVQINQDEIILNIPIQIEESRKGWKISIESTNNGMKRRYMFTNRDKKSCMDKITRRIANDLESKSAQDAKKFLLSFHKLS